MTPDVTKEVARELAQLVRGELLEAAGRTRVWLSVREVMTRTGRGRRKVLDALQLGVAHRDGGGYRPGDLRGYQDGPGGEWSVHVDDVDAWVRREVPAAVRPVSEVA